MHKIKILRIIARLNIGGPAIQAVLLTKEFNNSEFESKLICGRVSKDEGDMGYIAERYGIKPIYITWLRREIGPLQDIVALYRIFEYIKKYKPDIVHTHTAKAGALGRVAAILAGVPLKVHTFHGNIFHGYFNRVSTRFFLLVERILAKFTDAIVAISLAQRDEIVKKYGISPAEKCHIVRLGFDLSGFLSLRPDFERDNINVGIIGRLTSIKNHRMFIDTVDYIDKHPDRSLANKIKFAVIGDGELKGELIHYTKRKGLENKVSFKGWLKNMDEVYRDLDIIALTSINEGTPVSLIEAMASSRPVVATGVGGVKDAVGEVGILVKSGDYKTMGDRILELAASPEKRQRLGALGRDFVRDIYSKKRLVSESETLYKDLLSKKPKENICAH